MRIRSPRFASVVAVAFAATGVLAPATALAAVPLQLQVDVGSTCVYGLKPSGGPITVKLLRADGSTRATRTDGTTGNEWLVCFASPVLIGNRLRMTTDTDPAPGTGVQTRTVTIPDLTIAVDRTTDKVKGHAPAGKPIQVRYSDSYPGGSGGWEIRTGTANSAGRWSKDLSSSADVDGSDVLAVTYQNSQGDQFWARTIAPYMEIKAPNKIFIGCQPRGTTTVKLRKSDGTVRAARSLTASTACGGKNGTFRRNGSAVNINTGNRITSDLASDAWLVWPMMSVAGSGSTVSGRCFANARFQVYVTNGSDSESWSGTTDVDGRFSDVGAWTFLSGHTLELICETSRGDRVRKARVLP